jgi:hypothetical protein
MTRKPGLWRRWGSYRPAKPMLFWACVACTIATMVIGFNWGGWVTGGTAAKLVQQGRTNLRRNSAWLISPMALDVDAQLLVTEKIPAAKTAAASG